jgi:two-component system cell cycle response regulator
MYMAKIAGRDQLVLHEDVETLAELHGTTLDLAALSGLAEAARDRLVSMASAMNHEMLEEAQREANQDALTRIHNRRYFDARLAREFDLARRQGTPISVALIDIDDFRLVNNTFGHPTGDLVLRGFADLAAQSIRGVDWLARYGGEEFCLVMPAGLEEAGQVAERIRGRANQASMQAIDGRDVAFTVSIGVVQYTPDVDADLVRLMHRASMAEREAKDAGKNRVIVSGA